MITLIADARWNEFAKMYRTDQSDVAGPDEIDPEQRVSSFIPGAAPDIRTTSCAAPG